MKIDIRQVRTIGQGLLRPEGVMALDDGVVYTADGRGRCARIEADGHTTFFGALGGMPNGICMDKKGNCIVANIGNGEVQSVISRRQPLRIDDGGTGQKNVHAQLPFS